VFTWQVASAVAALYEAVIESGVRGQEWGQGQGSGVRVRGSGSGVRKGRETAEEHLSLCLSYLIPTLAAIH